MRYEVDFIGRVQGVGFRAAAASLAREHDVVGWIRNEPEGSVKLVIEGDEARLKEYLDQLRTRMKDYISSENLHTSEDRGQYVGFEIRY